MATLVSKGAKGDYNKQLIGQALEKAHVHFCEIDKIQNLYEGVEVYKSPLLDYDYDTGERTAKQPEQDQKDTSAEEGKEANAAEQ